MCTHTRNYKIFFSRAGRQTENGFNDSIYKFGGTKMINGRDIRQAGNNGKPGN